MKKLVFAALMFALVLALAVPASTIQAQDRTRVDVWIAFQDYRLDWTNEKAA